MLYLNKIRAQELINHSLRNAPLEACGILAGNDSRVEKVYPVTNQDNSAKTFFMEPKEQLAAMKDIRKLGLEFLGIYHSHLQSEAYPSAHDVKLAFYPEASYVIVSLKDQAKPIIKSFKIVEGKISEEEVSIKD